MPAADNYHGALPVWRDCTPPLPEWPYRDVRGPLTETLVLAGEAARKLPLNEQPGAFNKCAQWVVEIYSTAGWSNDYRLSNGLTRVGDDRDACERYAIGVLKNLMLNDERLQRNLSENQWAAMEEEVKALADFNNLCALVKYYTDMFAIIRWVPVARPIEGNA